MKRALVNFLAGAALAAAPAFAQFEGEIDTRITGQGGFLATQKVFVSKAAVRSEIDMESEGTRRAELGIDFENPWPRHSLKPVRMVTLSKSGSPPVMYLIDDEAKTYSEMKFKKTGGAASKMTGEKEPYDAKVLGSESVFGYSTKRVLVSRPGDRSEMEVWTTKDLGESSGETTHFPMFFGPGEGDGAMMKALRDAKADGIFVKRITREKGRTEPLTTMELTRAERRSLPASMFEVPSGYQLRPLPSMKMEKMTFQERKRLEELKQQQKN